MLVNTKPRQESARHRITPPPLHTRPTYSNQRRWHTRVYACPPPFPLPPPPHHRQLRAIDRQLAGRHGRRASTPRHNGSTGGREERDRSNTLLHTGVARGSAAPSSIGSGIAGTPRAHGSCSPPAGMPRGGGGGGGAGRTSEARGPKGRVLSSSGGGAGLGAGSEQGATSARGGDEVWCVLCCFLVRR